MRIGIVILMCWSLVLVLSCAAVVVHLRRHRTRSLPIALLCPVGAGLMLGFYSAAVGLMEGSWTWRSGGVWIAMAIGAMGVVLEVLGCRAVLRTPLGAGQCRTCGYDLAGLSTCPECGHPRVPMGSIHGR